MQCSEPKKSGRATHYTKEYSTVKSKLYDHNHGYENIFVIIKYLYIYINLRSRRILLIRIYKKINKM